MSEALPILSIPPHGFEPAFEAAISALAAHEEDRTHAALHALPDARYRDVIEFARRPSELTRKLAARASRLVSSVAAAPVRPGPRADISDLDNVQSRDFTAPLALPARRYNLVVFTDILAALADADVDRLTSYTLATLAPGGHCLLVHWLAESDARLTGDAAAERLIGRTRDTLQPILRRRMPLYRVDVLERV
jgi:hypothetical protein